ncbi:MAG: DUF2232 domain-containing protein [Acidithiobacillus sp.]
MNRADQSSGFLGWFLSGRWQASAAVVLLFALARLLPVLALPLLINVVALLALVTMQAGRRESLEVLAIATVGVGIVTWSPAFALAFVLLGWLPGRLIGEGLLWREDWRGLLWALAVLGALCLVVTLWVLPGATGPEYWQSQFGTLLKPLADRLSAQQKEAIDLVVPFTPGVVSLAVVLMGTVAGVLASRWRERLQGDLRVRRPFSTLVLPAWWIWPFLLATAASLVLTGLSLWWVENLTLFLSAFYLLQGLSLVHLWFALRSWPAWGLVVFYLGLILLSQLALPVMLLGILDRFFSWHGRLRPPGQ